MYVSICVSHQAGGYAYHGNVNRTGDVDRRPFGVLEVTELERGYRGASFSWHFNTAAQIDEAIAELFALRRQLASLLPDTDAGPACAAENACAEFGEPVA